MIFWIKYGSNFDNLDKLKQNSLEKWLEICFYAEKKLYCYLSIFEPFWAKFAKIVFDAKIVMKHCAPITLKYLPKVLLTKTKKFFELLLFSNLKRFFVFFLKIVRPQCWNCISERDWKKSKFLREELKSTLWFFKSA